jgi:hypothetical protein
MELVDAQAIHSFQLPWERMQIMPVGDIQYDGPKGAADIKRLSRHLAWGMKNNVWFLGTGDLIDILSPSNRERFAAAKLYDTATTFFDEAVTQLEYDLFKILAPTKGRWLGLVGGHHYYPHLDGSTTDTRFATWLDCPYLGDCAIIRLHFRDEKAKQGKVFKIWVHHGNGGSGVLPTGVINKLYHQKVRYPNVRLFLMGHVPQLGHMTLEGLDSEGPAGDPHLTHEDTKLVACGGFSRSYQQGSKYAGRAQGGYAEKGMMPPAVLGGALITLTPEVSKFHGRSVRTIDIKVSS